MIDTDKYEGLLYELENKLMQRISDGDRPSDIDLEGVVGEVHDLTSDSGSSGIFLMLMNDGSEWLRIAVREEVEGFNEVIDAMTQEIERWQAMRPNQLRECLWWCYDLKRFGKEINDEDWGFIGRLLGADTDHNDNEWSEEE
jgi:hypothetical protein